MVFVLDDRNKHTHTRMRKRGSNIKAHHNSTQKSNKEKKGYQVIQLEQFHYFNRQYKGFSKKKKKINNTRKNIKMKFFGKHKKVHIFKELFLKSKFNSKDCGLLDDFCILLIGFFFFLAKSILRIVLRLLLANAYMPMQLCLSKRHKCTFSPYILTFSHFNPYILFLPML